MKTEAFHAITRAGGDVLLLVAEILSDCPHCSTHASVCERHKALLDACNEAVIAVNRVADEAEKLVLSHAQ